VEDFAKTAEHSPFTLTQTALRFALAQPAISVVIVGCKTVAQVEENFKTSDLALPVSTH
jgi:aryl-alcohol dehydrogenase-like predicted oxidoreductase